MDGKFTAGVDAETVIREKLYVGLKLENEKVEKIILKQQETKLLEKALKLLGFRQRSEKEVARYLYQKIARENSVKFNEAKESPIAKGILLKLKKYGLINDEEFAKWWVSARSKQKGRIIIRAELIQKGIDRELIEETLSNLKDEASVAIKALERKIKSWLKLDKYEFKKKVYSYLIGRGFSSDIISDVIAFFTKKE